jgi:hypothetical protein
MATSRRRDGSAWLGLATAAAILALAACAPLEPITANVTFLDRPAAVKPVASAGCVLNVSEVVDGRAAPDTLGIVAGRAVKAPLDSQAWLRSILQGFDRRGFQVDFRPAAAPNPAAITMKVRLQKAWLTSVATNKNANVVLHIRAERAGLPPLDADYRGDLSVLNWASTAAELQRLVDASFAKALDDMTPPLRRLCPA